MYRKHALLALSATGLMVALAGAHGSAFSRSRASAALPGAPSCPVFPASNVWNKDISALPVAANSDAMISSIGLATGLHPDFGSNPDYGIPYNTVSGSTPKSSVTFDYADESDAGPYPIPASPAIEAGGDHHILIVDRDACTLYELYNAQLTSGSWHAGSGAIWSLQSNALRPDGWTSADAAGLPILPGLARYDEVAAGVINHALRFTAANTRNTHIYPARHDAGSNNAAYPPMGLRVRLKASVDISGFSSQAQVILAALKKYGMILADNGSNWYISGASDPNWNDDDLHHLNQITGANLEVVDTSTLVNGPDSATATPTSSLPTTTRTPVPPTNTATVSPSTATATKTPAAPTPTPAGTTVVLTPVADAYVRDGGYASTNFGAATSLYVRRGGTGSNRVGYLRFNLSGLSGTVTGATLRLYGRNSGTGSYSGADAVYSVANTTWTETGTAGITWNTRPALGSTALGSTTISTAARYYSWNIGTYVATAQQGTSHLMSVALTMPSTPSDNAADQFNAREATSNQPQLVVTTR